MGQNIDIDGLPAYEVQTTGTTLGGIIVIHEVWGLNEHTKNIAGRFADEGFHAVAPDLLSETDIAVHATAEMQRDLFDPVKRTAVQPKLRELMAPLQAPGFAEATHKKVQQVFDYLYAQQNIQQKVAVVGYCFGGTYSFTLAVKEPRLTAAVPYYGHCNYSVEELSKITCPILAFYGGRDENLMNGLPELEEKMHQARVDFTAQVYADAGHAFFNDANPSAYNRAAATDAWQRTIEFLKGKF